MPWDVYCVMQFITDFSSWGFGSVGGREENGNIVFLSTSDLNKATWSVQTNCADMKLI